jgi:hypothetical protein
VGKFWVVAFVEGMGAQRAQLVWAELPCEPRKQIGVRGGIVYGAELPIDEEHRLQREPLAGRVSDATTAPRVVQLVARDPHQPRDRLPRQFAVRRVHCDQSRREGLAHQIGRELRGGNAGAQKREHDTSSTPVEQTEALWLAGACAGEQFPVRRLTGGR